MATSDAQNMKLGVRPETRRKYEEIARVNRMTLVEAADAAADLWTMADEELRQRAIRRRERGDRRRKVQVA